MELDELKNRVDSLKRAKEKGHGDLMTRELLLLWDFVQTISDKSIDGHKNLAEYLLSSGIKSVSTKDLIENHDWKKPFASFAEFEDAVNSETPFKL